MIDSAYKFLQTREPVLLSKISIEKIIAARNTVMDYIHRDETIYGINTGFGKLSTIKIAAKELADLQVNLLRSHACGVGEPISTDIVALMMYLKIQNLSKGHSGCSLEVIEKLAELLNKQIYPVIPRRGSVGASGDLAPLAHMCLPLIGEGEVQYRGEVVPAEKLVKQGVYSTVTLGPKDGLSLINGTQYSTALILYALAQLRDIFVLAELAAAMSVEAVLATDIPFSEHIQRIRKQNGQNIVAGHLRNFLRNSAIIRSHVNCQKVQDPYSFRCTPQVLGAVYDTMKFVENIVNNEIQAVTDNPLVFPETGKILSGGNFHAEPIALAADYLAIAVTELANLSERRIATLLDSGMSGLPAFLTDHSGVNSGFMIAHVTAAALCAENRTLSNPASVETIPTSANQEDHVSMAPNAGLKLLQIIENTRHIIWIEFLSAAQGIDYRNNFTCGDGTRKGYEKVRSLVPHLDKDRIFYKDLEKSQSFYNDRGFIRKVHTIANESV
ncbi:MAG: histidine ammonia-lyase [Candidatus Marinimicrobia bacterium]|nr:histidine ammonia-lyase [Candidatus Neomarinimicrobiota bacterium]